MKDLKKKKKKEPRGQVLLEEGVQKVVNKGESYSQEQRRQGWIQRIGIVLVLQLGMRAPTASNDNA